MPHAQEPIINWQFKLRSGQGPSRLFEQPQEAVSNQNQGFNDADEDTQLVRQLQNGNHDALTSLYEKYSGSVFNLARRVLKNSGEAEEVVQRVFIDTYKAIHQFDPQRASYKTWLFQFAYHRSLNRKRDIAKSFYASVELDEQQLMTELYEGAGRFVRQLSSEETIQLTRQLLKSGSIRRKERVAISLTFYYGFTAEEIAARTGESPAAVRHNLYRGLAKLRSALLDTAQQKATGSKNKTERMLVVDPAQLL